MSNLRAMVVCLTSFGLAALGGEGETTEETTKLVTYLAREFNYGFVLVGTTPAKRLEEIIADDVAIVWSNGERSTGKAECLARVAKARGGIKEICKDFSVLYESEKVRLLGNASIILAKVTLLGTLAEDEKPFRREVWQTLIFAKSEGGWRLVHEHANQIAARKPAEPEPKDTP